jgi:hypothetical protein
MFTKRRNLFFIILLLLSNTTKAQQLVKYGETNAYSFNGTLLSVYNTIDEEYNYTDTVKLYYSIEADSLVMYTVTQPKNIAYAYIYRKALAVKDINIDKNNFKLVYSAEQGKALYSFKINAASNNLMKGTSYSHDKIEYYSGEYLYFAFCKQNKKLAESTKQLFEELFAK